MAELILPERHLVPSLQTAEGDHLVDLIYHPIAGLLYRQRFRMALQALEQAGPCEALLEVGFGAGLLLPSLARICPRVEAVDVHGRTSAVETMLNRLSLEHVRLRRGDIFELPYPDHRFSHLICVSVLEHLREIEAAARELARVTHPGGWVVLGIPTKNPITKGLFRTIGYRDDVIHPSSHRDILKAARSFMTLERVTVFPWGMPLDLSLYIVARLRVPSYEPASFEAAALPTRSACIT